MNDIFLGRERQLQDFGRVLDELFDASRAPTLPPVVLISGQGGIGKSTLLRELHAMAEQRYPGRFHRLDVDWQVQRQENPSSFAVDPRQIDPLAILRTVHRRAADAVAGWRSPERSSTSSRRRRPTSCSTRTITPPAPSARRCGRRRSTCRSW